MSPKFTVNTGAQLDVNNSAMEQTKLLSLPGAVSTFLNCGICFYDREYISG
jgi:hypothetical protein